ncbi:MAG: hypothetical protein V4683_15615 [Bacteroidota bacterium]
MKKKLLSLFTLGILLIMSYSSIAYEGSPPDKPRSPVGPFPPPPQ